jgi:hypothetical protein
VPLILVAYMVVALWQAQYSPTLVIIFISISSAYLAWHYTGQVWGMMASYTYLDGRGFDKSERFLIRTGLRILLAWHVTWFLYTQLRNPGVVRPAYLLISAATIAAFVLGAVGIARMRRRTGRLPPARALVAWLAIFVWYAVMARDPKALFWIQLAHALQYLAFPIRVELNRLVGKGGAAAAKTAGNVATHMVLYACALLILSYVVSRVVPGPAMSAVANMFGEEPGKAAPVLILMFINIHHYFTDGVIWKISNPEVRQELFAHVKRPPESAKASPAVKAPSSDSLRPPKRARARR